MRADNAGVNQPNLSRFAANRLVGFSETIFAEMSALATSTDSINLGQGFPDDSGPESVIEAAVAALRAGRNQYPPGHGDPLLIEAVRDHQRRHYGLNLAPDEVVITTGATEAIAAAVLALVDPGDEVLVIEPCYDSYPAMVQFAGGVRRSLTLTAPDFRIDPVALSEVVTPATRVLIWNSPHNPTGRVFDLAELSAIAEVAIEHDLVVISDEVYEHLAFTPNQHIPIATLPGMYERTITISSAGKTFSLTGWKIGWATGPTDLVHAVEGAKNWLSYSSGAPLQPAIAHALRHEEGFPLRLRDQLHHNSELLHDGLAELGLTTFTSQGTYFITTDVAHLGFASGIEFCRTIAHQVGVVAIPSSTFYPSNEAGQTQVRWACCKRESVLREGLERLSELRQLDTRK